MERMPVEQESEADRSERQLGELLSELRIAMPGVQLLFAFLLVVPFNQRFAHVSHFERSLYLGVLLCAAFASALLIAPTAYHRIMLHHGDRPRLIRSATRMMLGGLGLLALAMSGAVLLVTDFLFGAATAIVCTALVVAAFAWLWFGLALVRRARGEAPRRP
jgi:hypothetical protein